MICRHYALVVQYGVRMDEENNNDTNININARAFAAFGMAIVSLALALFVLWYTMNPRTPVEPTAQPMTTGQVQ